MSHTVQLILFITFYFSACLVVSQMTLPSMVTIPPDSEQASSNSSSNSSSLPTFAMTIYDQACLDEVQSSSNDSSSSGNSTSSPDVIDDDQISQWVQSQFIVYVGAVALNGNNTCQVICQVQSLTQFSILFGQDIRTRSVLVGRVYMTKMADGTTCSAGGSNGTCSSGECSASGGGESTTEGTTGSDVSTASSNSTDSSGATTSSSGSSDMTTSSSSSNSTETTSSGGGGSTTLSGTSNSTEVANATTTAAPSG